jgi:hypothetical protein
MEKNVVAIDDLYLLKMVVSTTMLNYQRASWPAGQSLPNSTSDGKASRAWWQNVLISCGGHLADAD